MKKLLFTTFFMTAMVGVEAQVIAPLAGFDYGRQDAPTGKEWENPELLSLNKLQPHAYFFDFANVDEAIGVLPVNSSFYQDLNGTWKFNWAPDPASRPADFYQISYDVSGWDDLTVPGCWNVQGIQKDGTLKYGVPIYCNQPVIFKHSVAVDDWKGGVMREPRQDWTTFKHRNEVGSYRREFTVPANWKDKEIYLNFDGVNSFFYLWINGQYVGFSKNSRNTASFDITPYLNPKGSNTLAVEVYRNSDGSFLEAQDMWRLPGIYRSVYLNAKSKVQVKDIIVRTSSIDYPDKATVKIEAYLDNLTKKEAKDLTIAYTVKECKLWSDEIAGETLKAKTEKIKVAVGETAYTALDIDMPAKLWSSETPHRYVLVGELLDKKGKVIETFSTYFGVRKVEIRDTKAEDDEFGLAGRYYYINDMPVKLKGVNRQEINLASGNTITHQQMIDEIMLMRRGNINHVRTSHYSNDPYWFYACDKYGIYLEDEANIESHQYYYGAASLSHVPEFRNAHVARVMEAVRAHINAPSIVIWSLGNEAGPGDNFKEAYKAIHEFDPSRPVQYERNNRIVDMGSNQYPSIGWMREAVKGKMDIVYPFHISEYAHSMGNAVGDLPQYWEAIESTNFFCGGAIWDWVDQALWNYDPKTGERYMAYGGDFGDKPNDGMFCMNGILYPDHSPKPAFYEVKKVYQYVGVKMIDAAKGMIEVFNKNYYTPMTDLEMVWSLWKDGKQVGDINRNFIGPKKIIGPRERQNIRIPYDMASLEKNATYHVKVQFLLANDMPWAKKGFVQAEEQFELPVEKNFPSIAEASSNGGALTVNTEAGKVEVAGNGFSVVFCNESGSIASLIYNGKETFAEGPKLDTWRAPVDNDNWARGQWAANGLNNLSHKAQGEPVVYTRTDGSVVVAYSVVCRSDKKFKYTGGASGHNAFEPQGDMDDDGFCIYAQQNWTVYPDGSVELQSGITSNAPKTDLARIGYAMKLPSEFDRYTYFGRGPKNNYNDRYTGSFVGLYESTVADQFEPFPKPQDMANREDVRWCALTTGNGSGVQFVATDKMSTSALPWSDMQLCLAPHPYQLPKSDGTYLHIDAKVTGLGGNSCGQGGPLDDDRTFASARSFGFIIRPTAANTDLNANAKVAGAGELPLTMECDRLGRLTITTERENAEICYTVVPMGATKKQLKKIKAQTYSQPIDMSNGGTVTAWYKDNDKIKTVKTYERIEIAPLEVIYASSQESDYGEAEHLVDGDPNTVWFTMYSVTVAQYPHWVDFDAGEEKTIKGFTYLPILDGTSGNIKHYRIQVSNDAKNWSEPVVEGEFGKEQSLQRVMFAAPVKARYIRFTGLDSQNGRDYGGGSEFNILVE